MTRRSVPPAPPLSPINLLATAVSGSEVILAWTEVGPGGLGFRIERATGGDPVGTFAMIGGVGPRVTAFRDGSAKPRMEYTYRVCSWNASGDSPPSIVVRVTTPQTIAQRSAARNDRPGIP